MDVERIQKINNLALELMKQGLASDREQAVAQAEKIFRHRGAEDYSSMRETMQKVDAEAKPEPAAEASVELPPDKMKEIMEQNTLFVVKKIKEIQDQMESMGKEIADLRSRIAFRTPAAPSNEMQAAPASRPVEQNNRDVPKNHPRSGNYTENDVSIEKFFYMGSKH